MFKVYCNLKNQCLEFDSQNLKSANLAIFGFNGLQSVNYKSELSGKTSVLHNFASLSRTGQSVVISGTITDNYGIIKKSLAVADKGKLLGISDMNLNFNGSNLSLGGGYKVYFTSIGKIGVIVGSDLLDSDGVKAMALCEADIIICVSDTFSKAEEHFLLRAYSYLYGVPIILVTSNCVMASDINGEISCKSPLKELEITMPIKKQYRLITNKKRGVKP
jgi:hypothetical protein